MAEQLVVVTQGAGAGAQRLEGVGRRQGLAGLPARLVRIRQAGEQSI